MNKQIIISVAREFGSGGHEIARELAKHFNISIYDKNILSDIAEEKGVDVSNLEKFDEIPKKRIFSRNLDGYSSSPQETIANMQFDFIRDKAESGESFVIVGRCADSILKGHEGLVSIFVMADLDCKTQRVAEYFDITEDKARDIVIRNNKRRKSYHNFYCKEKWGDSTNYDLMINTSKIGISATAEVVKNYVERIIAQN